MPPFPPKTPIPSETPGTPSTNGTAGAGTTRDDTFTGSVGEQYVLSRSGKALNIVSPINQGRFVIEIDTEGIHAVSAWLRSREPVAVAAEIGAQAPFDAQAEAAKMVPCLEGLPADIKLGEAAEWLKCAHAAGDATGYARGVAAGRDEERARQAKVLSTPIPAPPLKLEVESRAQPPAAVPPAPAPAPTSVGNFSACVRAELDHAYAKHGREQWSRHEFYAVLKEEVDELWDAIKRDLPTEELLKESMQIACVCQRYAETGDRYRGEHPTMMVRAASPTRGEGERHK